MRTSSKNPEERLPLTQAAFHILLSLADGERHGYSIMRDISTHTKGKLRLGPATLYRSIKHLEEDSLIEESNARPDPALDDERRRYYRLTESGREVLVAEVRRLEDVLMVARTKRSLSSLLSSPSIEEGH
ncbi:PadR family transcriptional regulator [Ktedonosporobacter rubrisoli]|uniref:PadR family transcriptional regulator n=1 Tax=Ktedonosporobacter rubrisoli TaxID=2509675 RepID=A0A4P6JK86_KTERU|nr:PadR family transcriptional regulator [Ktedonosporobacter rubrisoli]QBD75559.1 PadR family transcriptional regulator [Ktedonosporobacter rubrisoli]